MKTLLKSFGVLWVLFILFSTRAAFGQAAMLRVGDTVEIRLAGVPAEEMGQFSAPYTIDDSGSMNLPYIGLIKIAGLGVSQAQVAIESKLKADKIYTHPTVTINIPNTTRFVNIGGQVRSPGRIPYRADLTLMSAINSAGGFTDYADKKRVTLTRDSKVQKIDTRQLLAHPEKDTKVLPGDQINVPQSWL